MKRWEISVLRRIIATLLFYPSAQALQVARLQEPQQGFLLFAPEVLRVRVIMAQQGLHFADLHSVVDPAFNFADAVDIGLIEKAMPAVGPLRFKQSIPSLLHAVG